MSDEHQHGQGRDDGDAADTAPRVRCERTVVAPVEVAFTVFTERFSEIKPPEHNFLGSPVSRTVIEPRAGGDAYDCGADGSTVRWGRVLAYDPPHRVVLSWDISPRFQLEPDPDRTSEVEIAFVADGPERTTVSIEHRNIDRHGPGWEAVVMAFGSPRGWPLHLDRFADLLPDPA